MGSERSWEAGIFNSLLGNCEAGYHVSLAKLELHFPESSSLSRSVLRVRLNRSTLEIWEVEARKPAAIVLCWLPWSTVVRRRHRCWWALVCPHASFCSMFLPKNYLYWPRIVTPRPPDAWLESWMVALKSSEEAVAFHGLLCHPPFPALLCVAPSSSASPNLSTRTSGGLPSGFPRILQRAFPSYHLPNFLP